MFRVVRNAHEGHGPVFNAGERVEAVTSPLWGWLLIVLDFVVPSVPVEWLSVLLGLAGSVGGLVLVQRAVVRALPSGGVLVPVGSLVIVALPPFWDYATSGLETGLSFLWLGWCADRVSVHLCRWDRGGSPVVDRSAAVVVGLGVLVRPDLAVVTLVLLGVLLWLQPAGARSVRSVVQMLGWMFALPVAYQVFRMGYYGLLVPNTALAKEGSNLELARGWTYLSDLVQTYVLVVPVLVVAVLLVAGWQRSRAQRRVALVGPTIAAMGIVHGTAITLGGGDYMHARLLLPALFALLGSVAVVRVADVRVLAAVGVAVVWAAACAISMRWDDALAFNAQGIVDARPVDVAFARTSNPVTLEDHAPLIRVPDIRTVDDLFVDDQWLAWEGWFRTVYLLPGEEGHPTAGLRAVGKVGYLLGPDVHIVDFGGLADPLASHLIQSPTGWTGHRKGLPEQWIVARFAPPDQDDDPRALPDDNPAARERAIASRAVARRVLECGPIVDVLDAAAAPMSPSRFLENFVGAPRRTLFRFPGDPYQALGAVC